MSGSTVPEVLEIEVGVQSCPGFQESHTEEMREFITLKRSALRDGHREPELLDLVREDIIPHYKKLPGCPRLGLLRIEGARDYLAMKHWENRQVWLAAISSASYSAWFEDYKPILERWERMMALVDEWETEDVLDLGHR